MKLIETIDECINQIQSELKSWKSVKDNQLYFESKFDTFNDVTKEEVDDNILLYQKHLDNLNLIKRNLNYGK
jgi:hypothetical protein